MINTGVTKEKFGKGPEVMRGRTRRETSTNYKEVLMGNMTVAGSPTNKARMTSRNTKATNSSEDCGVKKFEQQLVNVKM